MRNSTERREAAYIYAARSKGVLLIGELIQLKYAKILPNERARQHTV